MTYLIALIIGYISIVVSDHLVHRNIMHGKWRFVRNSGPFFQMWLYPHYVQHRVVHHSHSIKSRTELRQGLPVLDNLKKNQERRFEGAFWPRLALACSDHGITIKDGVCLFSFLSLFLITPQYLVAVLVTALWGVGHGAIIVLFTLLPAYNHFHHRFYHMDAQAKERLSPWYLRWVILSREVEKISREHMEHHHSRERADDYYNLLPFGRYLLRPIFGRH